MSLFVSMMMSIAFAAMGAALQLKKETILIIAAIIIAGGIAGLKGDE